MKFDSVQLKLLGLSRKEAKVLEAVWKGKDTPLLIARETSVSRPATYEILARLKKRGLVKTTIRDGKRYWLLAKSQDLEVLLYNTKKALFGIEDGVEEVHGVSDATVIVHRGAKALQSLIHSMMNDHKNQRIYMTAGDKVTPGWARVIGLERINEFNRSLKENKLISEVVATEGLFERQTAENGIEWAISFEGRTAMTHYVSPEYLDNAGQLWVIGKSLYLMAIQEEIIIEVRNSEIQKLVLSLFHFMQDHSRKIDVNALLRDLIAEEEKRKMDKYI
jgi:hypothetical protein